MVRSERSREGPTDRPCLYSVHCDWFQSCFKPTIRFPNWTRPDQSQWSAATKPDSLSREMLQISLADLEGEIVLMILLDILLGMFAIGTLTLYLHHGEIQISLYFYLLLRSCFNEPIKNHFAINYLHCIYSINIPSFQEIKMMRTGLWLQALTRLSFLGQYSRSLLRVFVGRSHTRFFSSSLNNLGLLYIYYCHHIATTQGMNSWYIRTICGERII